MRTWLEEGRIAADSLVWREGWRDWQEAGDAFPSLKDGSGPDLGDFMPLTSPAASSSPRGGSARGGHRPTARRSSNATAAVIITVLVIAVIILLFVFIYVLTSP